MKYTKTDAEETFGSYLRFLLNKYGHKSKDIARLLGFRPPYISDVLAGNNKPFKLSDLEKVVKQMPWTQKEVECLYDLAGQERNEIAPDLMALAKDSKQVHNLLRIIKRNKINEKQLQQICESLSSKGWK